MLRVAELRAETNGAGFRTAFRYDNDGLLTGGDTTFLPDTGTDHIFDITRRADSGLLSGTTLDKITTTLEYTPFGELKKETAAFDGALLYEAVYTYDKLSRVETKTETVAGGAADFYEYDYHPLNGRLQEVKQNGAVVEAYQYDANGNRSFAQNAAGTVDNIVTDDQDRLLEYGDDTTYTYTANGELRTKTVAGQTTVYHYDVFNNLTKVEQPDGTTIIEYPIDPADRRAAKKIDGILQKTWLYHGPVNPVAETDAGGDITAYFVYGTQEHVPDYMVTADGVYRYITDHNGSVRLLVNAADGTIAQRLDYDTWGNVLFDSNSGFQPFGFAGGHYDPDTKLVRFGGRDYDPETGRWTTQDPIGHSGGDSNLYAYVYNDPVNEIDPSGYFLQMLVGCLARGALETAAEAALTGNLECMGAGDWIEGALSGCNPFSLLGKMRKAGKILKAANKGGGKNAQHANQAKRDAAEKKYDKAKKEYERLKSTPNKTPEIKKALDKAEKSVNKAKQDMDYTGENHSQRHKGNR